MKIFAKINNNKKCNQGTKNVIFFVLIEKFSWQKRNKGVGQKVLTQEKINFLDISVCRCNKSNDLLANVLCRIEKIETIQLAPILLKRTETCIIHAENVRNKTKYYQNRRKKQVFDRVRQGMKQSIMGIAKNCV